MTQLSAPAPSPSTPKRPSGRYIDFVARPKTAQTTLKPTHAPKPLVKSKKPRSESAPVAPTHIEATPRRHHIAPRGLRMDFVRRPKDAPFPEIKVKKTVQIPIASSRAESMPEMSTPRRIAPTESMPEMSAPRRAVRRIKPVEIISDESKEFIEPEDSTKSLMDDDDLSLALAGFADDDGEEMPRLTDDRAREVADLEDELNALDEFDEIDKISNDLEAEIANFVDEPKPMFEKKKPDAPDANKFSLGGRSPFLSSVKVEKRPLSGIVSDEEVQPIKKEAKTPLKNAYRAKIKQVLKSDKTDNKTVTHRETTIVSTPNTPAHNISLAFAILLTVILGGLIGAVVYLVFFQQ